MTYEVTRNATSSLVEGSGPSQPDLLDDLTSAPCGRAPARASRSARPARASEPMIQGICGRTFIGSSVPAGPLSSWESRLRDRLATVGSTESALIWREKITPAGLSISRLAPSMRHTNGTDFTGSQWSTPRASDGEKGAPRQMFSGGGMPLPAQMYSYNPTPTVADVTGGRKHRSGARNQEPLLNGLLSSYPMATWPTVTSEVSGDTIETHELRQSRVKARHGRRMGTPLNVHMQHAATVHGGPMPHGSSAPSTEKRGVPNPAFPFWLMGFPDEWICGALAAMRSRQSSRRKSSRRTSKPKQSVSDHQSGLSR